MRTLERFNIADKVTRCSYMFKGYAFLEEDCDAPLLLNALDDAGLTYTVKVYHGTGRRQSRIRNYPRYQRATEKAIICPYCDKVLQSSHDACCGESGHGAET
jgi:hypothetical protein